MFMPSRSHIGAANSGGIPVGAANISHGRVGVSSARLAAGRPTVTLAAPSDNGLPPHTCPPGLGSRNEHGVPGISFAVPGWAYQDLPSALMSITTARHQTAVGQYPGVMQLRADNGDIRRGLT